MDPSTGTDQVPFGAALWPMVLALGTQGANIRESRGGWSNIVLGGLSAGPSVNIHW
jgi:hypothetical protein